jgi:C4-dicarboxylate-specific signal transduction histidine kinase
VARFNHPVWFKWFWVSRYGFAVLLLTATLIISVWLTPLIGLGIARFGGRLLAFPGPLFMCAVMLCAWYGGIGPSLLATAVSGLAFHYYFWHSPAHPKPDEMRPLLISISQNLLIGLLSAAQRKVKESLRHARDDLKLTVEDLQRTNEALQAESRERKQTEEALSHAQADLARASRLSSMGELSASLAHEINQPIAATIIDANTCLRWLSRDQPDLEETRAAVVRIAQDGKRASEIISRVRMLFRKGIPQRELVNLNETIQEMVLLLHSEATMFAVSTRTELATDLPQVVGDRVQLQQVLMNLMMNSIDAMKDVNGARELTVQSQRGEDGQVLISVTDTGIGLPPQQADKIFDAFFTTKQYGTGIGLRISRSIIESHGGRLWAVNNPPHGARFCFTLPVSGETRDPVASEDRKNL